MPKELAATYEQMIFNADGFAQVFPEQYQSRKAHYDSFIKD
jgi:hypothetical protein